MKKLFIALLILFSCFMPELVTARGGGGFHGSGGGFHGGGAGMRTAGGHTTGMRTAGGRAVGVRAAGTARAPRSGARVSGRRTAGPAGRGAVRPAAKGDTVKGAHRSGNHVQPSGHGRGHGDGHGGGHGGGHHHHNNWCSSCAFGGWWGGSPFWWDFGFALGWYPWLATPIIAAAAANQGPDVVVTQQVTQAAQPQQPYDYDLAIHKNMNGDTLTEQIMTPDQKEIVYIHDKQNPNLIIEKHTLDTQGNQDVKKDPNGAIKRMRINAPTRITTYTVDNTGNAINSEVTYVPKVV